MKKESKGTECYYIFSHQVPNCTQSDVTAQRRSWDTFREKPKTILLPSYFFHSKTGWANCQFFKWFGSEAVTVLNTWKQRYPCTQWSLALTLAPGWWTLRRSCTWTSTWTAAHYSSTSGTQIPGSLTEKHEFQYRPGILRLFLKHFLSGSRWLF